MAFNIPVFDYTDEISALKTKIEDVVSSATNEVVEVIIPRKHSVLLRDWVELNGVRCGIFHDKIPFLGGKVMDQTRLILSLTKAPLPPEDPPIVEGVVLNPDFALPPPAEG